MGRSAARSEPLVLVSGDYNPSVWQSRSEPESAFDSWLAVAQDVWGRGCFRAGQKEAMQHCANSLPIDKSKVAGVIGRTLGGLGAIAAESGVHLDVVDCNKALLDFLEYDTGVGKKYLKQEAWYPAAPELRAGRYHGLIASGAFGASADAGRLAKVLAAGLKSRGQIVVDEIYAEDTAAAALIAQGVRGPSGAPTIHAFGAVAGALAAAGFEPKWKVAVTDRLIASIATGLTNAQEIAQRLKEIPQPFRKQRMTAYADELQRTAVLHQALQRGLVTAVRTKHGKK
jgi:hypothetical protein